MTTVLSLLGRCGIGSTQHAAVNDIIDDEPQSTNPQTARVTMMPSLGISCIAPSGKYQPITQDTVTVMLEKAVPQLLECISRDSDSDGAGTNNNGADLSQKQLAQKKTDALQQLHDLTKKGNEINRVPLLSSQKWDILHVLSAALLQIQTADKEMNSDQRLICWTLNNLSIPYENKAIMSQSTLLFQALGSIIDQNSPCTYLCIICFMNLTFLAEAIDPVVYYAVPTTKFEGVISTQDGNLSEKSRHVLENPSSLVRVLERMMISNTAYLAGGVTSVQGEAVRWTCGLVRNITFATQGLDEIDVLSGSSGRQGLVDNSAIEEICTLLSQTEIPRLIVGCVRDSTNPTVKWTKDSLEDICLGVICQLAQWPSSRDELKRAGAVQSLEKVEG